MRKNVRCLVQRSKAHSKCEDRYIPIYTYLEIYVSFIRNVTINSYFEENFFIFYIKIIIWTLMFRLIVRCELIYPSLSLIHFCGQESYFDAVTSFMNIMTAKVCSTLERNLPSPHLRIKSSQRSPHESEHRFYRASDLCSITLISYGKVDRMKISVTIKSGGLLP